MIQKFFCEQIKKHFPYTPTDEQNEALERLSRFLFSGSRDALFVLKGYAGTGKSSLIGALVKTCTQMNQKTVLLAPTGRAAKVFAAYAEHPAYTIHKKIYRQKSFGDESGFVLAPNLQPHTLFIVDEASMIANSSSDTVAFGSGHLLDDLIEYVYGCEGCRLILLGDSAQLPPVSQAESPALDASVLRAYHLELHEMTLTQVVRQAEKSGILMNATFLRRAIEKGQVKQYPKVQTEAYPDVSIVRNDTLIETIESAYDRDGIEETIVISRSNKRANQFNDGIRNRILWREEELSSGDWLMVAKNNYFWAESCETMDFIANGDLMQVRRIRKMQNLYGFRFCDITAYFPDYETELDVKILMETLHTDAPGLPKEMSDKLFYAVMEDYVEVATKKAKMKKLKADPFYNVVQVKYAYAVTCHKAQGGQWKNVFLDLSYIPEEYLDANFYRWLYTAFTRATERLYLVNPVADILTKSTNTGKWSL
ncbi:MAG: AAA family ATPase [Candidatus Symbiothrix sp.]|jgi:exodeoxyribonuclease-5|nr:AAA family ATPase [Candidatus Symbiothrix sp.]